MVKNKVYTKKELMNKHQKRSRRAKTMDELYTTKTVFYPGEIGVKKWIKTPNRFDIFGVDTQKRTGKKHRYRIQQLYDDRWKTVPKFYTKEEANEVYNRIKEGIKKYGKKARATMQQYMHNVPDDVRIVKE